jgi:two-component system sensor histidine kinase AlgZ
LPWLANIGDRFWHQSPLLVSLGVALFLLSSAVHYILIALADSRDAETRALRMQVLATEAELRALRSQITPHFLFNSLNSINALTSSDPAGARRMCLLLSDFLRGTLQVSSHERIPLAQELLLIDQFLAIEQVRFGERLLVERAIDDESFRRLLPPLLLQPLVENAVTHGISNMLEGGTVRIAARAEGGRLIVAIENPRDPEARRRAGAGLGLTNVRRRLEAAYGREATVNVEAAPDRFRVELTMPSPPAESVAPPAPAPTPSSEPAPASPVTLPVA